MLMNAYSGFGAGQQGESDPYWNNVVSLLHFDGNLTDQKGRTWTAVGNAAATGTAKYGANSLTCDGTGDEIYSADSADWNVGSGDWTIEFWIRINAVGQANNSEIFCQHTSATSPFSWAYLLIAAGTNNLRLYSSSNQSSWNVISAAVIGTATQNQWHFVSVSRQGGNVYCHFDGVVGSTSNVGTTNFPDRAHPLYLMGGNYSGCYTQGQMDEFRFTKGVGRYGSTNYTPPTAAFPNG